MIYGEFLLEDSNLWVIKANRICRECSMASKSPRQNKLSEVNVYRGKQYCATMNPTCSKSSVLFTTRISTTPKMPTSERFYMIPCQIRTSKGTSSPVDRGS